MANKGFFRTVKAFSRRTAILAGALAAAFFASSALISCSDLNGGYGGTDQGENSSVVILGDLPAGMGRVCGKIQNKNDKSSASKTVAPDSATLETQINHYDICAWGTPDSGSPVPESSPIHGTVNASTRAFDISLPFGSWTLRADAIDIGSKIILSKKSGQITLSDDNPVISANFSLDYYAKSDETGKLGLPLSYDTSRITTISYSLDSEPPATGISISDTVDVTGAGGTFNLDGTTNSAFDALPPGTYNLVVEFCDANGVVVRLDQKVQIYSNLTTGKISGSAPYVNSSGQVDVTATVIQKYESSSFYVGGTGASDSNKGTRFDPLLTIKSAMARINASSLPAATTEFTIYVQDDVDLAASVSIASGKKISIVGTKSGSKSAIDGAASYGIAMGGSSLTCKNVTFNKIHGFEISAGQADFANCSITNGSPGSGASGNGGGLYISGSSAKATLESCTISGCEASYGGAIYTAGQAELKDCLIGAEASEAAQAADTKHSNKATSSGGGIYIAGTGELTLNGSNTISYNYAAVYGGGIYIGADVDLTACVVKNNLASRGGGIYAAGGNATMDDTCEIALNVANKESAPGNGFGGGMFVGGGSTTFEMNGGKISGNSADKGGGFYTENSSGRVEINDGEISENHASGQGDGIYHKSSTLKINGGKICDNDESGVYIDNPSGGAWVTMTDGQISGHTDCGVRLLEGDGNNFDMSGGKISGNEIGVYVAQAYNSMGSGFIMSGGAQLVDNCVYLAKDSGGDVAKLRVKAALTSAELPVATIWPEEYILNTQVISFASGDLATSESAKFAVKDDAEGEAWAVAASAATGVLKTASIYVDGSAAPGGSGTKDSPCNTLADALSKVSLPNSTIFVSNFTDSDYEGDINITSDAKFQGLTIKKSAGSTSAGINGSALYTISIASGVKLEGLSINGFGGVNITATDKVTLNDMQFILCKSASGGALWLDSGTEVEATNLVTKRCSATGSSASAGGIYVGIGAKLSVDGLRIIDCEAVDGGGIYNAGITILKGASITGCTATGNGAAIYNANGATLVLDGDCNIDSQIYLFGGSSAYPANPIYVKADFGLASGATKIPVAVEERSGADEQFQDGDAVVQGYDDGSGSAYEITAAQCGMFVLPGSKYSLKYVATPTPCGKLVDNSITGGITVNVGGNITFEIAAPTASGEKARFNVVDNSSGTPTYITPDSAEIKIMQYGEVIYSANAQEVNATFLTEGEYELYCKAALHCGTGWVTPSPVVYDTTVPFAAGGKYTPLTLEAAQAGAKVTFDNKATGVVKYRVNGGAEHEIASGTSEAITLSAVGDRVQFYGDNTYYAEHDGSGNYNVENYTASNIACTADCYVYGNIMSLVDSAGFASAMSFASPCALSGLFMGNTHIKNKSGIPLSLPATTLSDGCYTGLFYGCTSLTSAPELPAMTLADRCYYVMFNGCTSLATAPALPATTLTESCYDGMFRDCTSLTTAPELPAPTLEEWSYRSMFNGCSNLNSVTCLATYIRNGSHIYTYGWLDGVAATGTFTKAPSMADWPPNSEHGIPTGWTVQGGGAGGVPAGFVVVEGSTVAGGDKFKVGSETGVFVAGRSVAISTFWICDHEVTQAEYQAVMGTNPSNFTGDNLPVEKVSWYDAITYCNKKSIAEGLACCYAVDGKDDPGQWGYTPHAGTSISGTITCDFTKKGYRLPTEAEWEYAARGGKAGCEAANPTDWAGTDSSSELVKYAWYNSNSDSKTHEVKTNKVSGTDSANSLGLYDMSGNVWEWCWDWSSSIDASTPAAGALSGSYRVIRGGSWDQFAADCSVVSWYHNFSPNARYYTLGFRVVRAAQ
ncbi:MAG: SUMF1/EgtB/PvdO family nonheme iron enzyme [Treponema sp.]|nr:SUMF1/EgtB/PvdO family nonheme iron enzyme [Treponema sp.]MEE3434001.1 SUMF1/EgtB/PvdO family nonheme iron enzyme [Treponema sp.]